MNDICQKFLSSWLPPGGSWIFWQSALRNRLAKKTDEGRRKLKIPTVVRWMAKAKTTTIHPAAFIYQPVATPHQSRQNIGSEMPIFHRDSFPPGEAKGQLRELVPFNVLRCSIRKWAASPMRVAKLATPTECGESHWLVATNGGDTPSVSSARRPLQWLCKIIRCRRLRGGFLDISPFPSEPLKNPPKTVKRPLLFPIFHDRISGLH